MSRAHAPVHETRPPATPPARRTVVAAGVLLIVVGALADAYSISHHLPYEFGGHGHRDRVGQEWMASGTALGPPLMPLVLLVALIPVATMRRWWGGAAEALLALVALAVLVGTLGEPSTRTVFEPGSLDVVQILFRLATVAATLALLGGTAFDLRSRVTRRVRVRPERSWDQQV
jgi:uncharacterized membrane protein